ncbi:ESX-1 secretion-associated protein [Mycobacterium sp. smrl_JER01]|uniref:ESX-1 secretion-associated protein n=1 Tax=Mycobacterium sp. smrl_JER01 TaxID=3402633 RepID=UPI003AC179DA
MLARLAADTASIRAYGADCTAHAAALDAATTRLSAAADAPTALGPVGARFVAALAQAAREQARELGRLGAAMAAGGATASDAAHAYLIAEDASASRITGAG